MHHAKGLKTDINTNPGALNNSNYHCYCHEGEKNHSFRVGLLYWKNPPHNKGCI